jgi:6-phosphogluconolactonase/glucosamine-6-phosphate isomerase/deaminase
MKTIYKYPLKIQDKQTISMPIGAQILSVQVQDEVVCLWALVEPRLPKREIEFQMLGTGHDAGHINSNFKHISTVQVDGGNLVFHVFQYLG